MASCLTRQCTHLKKGRRESFHHFKFVCAQEAKMFIDQQTSLSFLPITEIQISRFKRRRQKATFFLAVNDFPAVRYGAGVRSLSGGGGVCSSITISSTAVFVGVCSITGILHNHTIQSAFPDFFTTDRGVARPSMSDVS